MKRHSWILVFLACFAITGYTGLGIAVITPGVSYVSLALIASSVVFFLLIDRFMLKRDDREEVNKQ